MTEPIAKHHRCIMVTATGWSMYSYSSAMYFFLIFSAFILGIPLYCVWKQYVLLKATPVRSSTLVQACSIARHRLLVVNSFFFFFFFFNGTYFWFWFQTQGGGCLRVVNVLLLNSYKIVVSLYIFSTAKRCS